MGYNISTHETFMHDAIKIETTCPICRVHATQRLGWTGVHCSYCKQYYDLDGWMGEAIALRRNALKMKRRDFAKLLGITRKTLANYETSRCSKKAHDKSLIIFKRLFKPDNTTTDKG